MAPTKQTMQKLRRSAANAPACFRCRWWVAVEDSENVGTCKLNPPIVLMDGRGVRPNMNGDDFCGSYEA